MKAEQMARILLLRFYLKLRFFRPPTLIVTGFLLFTALLTGLIVDLLTKNQLGYLTLIPASLISSWYFVFNQNSQFPVSFLIKANSLNNSLDQNVIFNNVLRLVVPEIADWSIIYLPSPDGSLKQAANLHIIASKKTHLDSFSFDNTHPIWHVIEKKAAMFFNGQSGSLILEPLFAADQLQAVIVLGTASSDRSYNQADLQIANQFAKIASGALVNADLYAQAQEGIKLRDEHLSLTSHELKTPLTLTLLKLQGVLQSIRQQSLATFSIGKMMEMLESAQQQTTRLTNLINDLLDLSAITTGRLSLNLEEMELSNVVYEMVIRFEEQLKEANCQIAVFNNTVVLGKWDPLRIEQVIANLLTNAIKYGQGKPIEISIEKSGSISRLKVKDQGIGISPEEQKEIFNRFKRGSNSPEYKGLGVGLYITKQIVVAHGGTIRVESQPGLGSTFIVELPIQNLTLKYEDYPPTLVN